MNERPGSASLLRFGLLAVLCLSACDCDDKLRAMFSNQEVDRRKARDQGLPDEASSTRESEPNDEPGEASELVITEELRPISGALSSPTDVDWLLLRRSARHKDSDPWMLTLELSAQDSALNLAASLRGEDPGDDPLAGAYDQAAAGEPEVLPLVALGDRPILLAIHASAASPQGGGYLLQIKKRMSASALAAEPNDRGAEAQKLGVPGELEGFYEREGDRDVVMLDIAPGGAPPRLLTLQLIGHAEMPQRMEIFARESLSTPLLKLEHAEGADSSAPLELPNFGYGVEGGRLFVVLSSQGKPSEKSWRLKVLETPGIKEFAEREPNDSEQGAQVIDRAQTLQGFLHHEGDVDRFTLTLPELPSEETGESTDKNKEGGAVVVDPDRGDGAAINLLVGEDGAQAKSWPKKAEPRPRLRVVLTPAQEGRALELRVGESSVATSSSAKEPAAFCELPWPGPDQPKPQVVVRRDASRDRLPSAKDEAGVEPMLRYGLEIAQVGRGEGEEVEPNAAVSSADRLPEGKEGVGRVAQPGDVDVWGFDLAPGASTDGVRKVEVVLTGSDLNLYVKLYDDEGGLVADVNRGGRARAEKVVIDLPPGRYFTHVGSSDPKASSCSPYQISWRQVSMLAP